MPSSTDRKRLEVPSYLHERLVDLAIDEDRTIASVVQEILTLGFEEYQVRRLNTDELARFTDRARHVIALARDETVSFNHNYLGTEHILLGLLREPEGIAFRVLSHLGVEYEPTRALMASQIGQGKGGAPDKEHLPFVPRARKVLRLAVEIADKREDHAVGTEHLLLALERVREAMAARFLDHFGALDRVRAEVSRVLTEENTAKI